MHYLVRISRRKSDPTDNFSGSPLYSRPSLLHVVLLGTQELLHGNPWRVWQKSCPVDSTNHRHVAVGSHWNSHSDLHPCKRYHRKTIRFDGLASRFNRNSYLTLLFHSPHLHFSPCFQQLYWQWRRRLIGVFQENFDSPRRLSNNNFSKNLLPQKAKNSALGRFSHLRNHTTSRFVSRGWPIYDSKQHIWSAVQWCKTGANVYTLPCVRSLGWPPNFGVNH